MQKFNVCIFVVILVFPVIVSGAIGKEVVHFEALPSNTVPSEMKGFIEWFNESQNTMNLLLFVCKYFFY